MLGLEGGWGACCRVIRLFGRIKALKNILTALTASIVPVLNAFLIMLVIAAICEFSAASPSIRPPRTPFEFLT
jgi:hypothetical protein